MRAIYDGNVQHAVLSHAAESFTMCPSGVSEGYCGESGPGSRHVSAKPSSERRVSKCSNEAALRREDYLKGLCLKLNSVRGRATLEDVDRDIKEIIADIERELKDQRGSSGGFEK